MSQQLYIWITRWEDFQHYKPERDRAPAWIKTYTRQLDDDVYLSLTPVQRAILHDLRIAFARANGKLPAGTREDNDSTLSEPRQTHERLASASRQLTQRFGYRVTSVQLEALNHAGLIDLCSREVLDQRLEKLYTYARAPARSREVEEELEAPPTPPQTRGETTSSHRTKTRRGKAAAPPLERALAFTRNAGHQYEPGAYEDELARYSLGLEEHAQALALYDELRNRTNGAQAAEDLPWEGEEPPVIT